MTRSHASLSALIAVVLAGTSALAQDEPPKKPDPAPAPAAGEAPKPAAAPEAKAERKVDPAATKALERYLAAVNLPTTSGLKEIRGKGSMDQMGETIEFDPKWNTEKGLDFDVKLPDAVKEMLSSQGIPEAQQVPMVMQQIGFAGIVSAFDPIGRNWPHFDVSSKQSGDDLVVELKPFDEKADAQSRTYVFGKDGIPKSASTVLKAPGNPVADSVFTFEKRGERHLIVGRKLSFRGMEIETRFTYYEGPSGSYLLKDATISSAVQGDQVIAFHDYVVDGKLVESTKAEAAKPAEKPKEKDATKPAETPPAPAPKEPAPKEEGK